MKYLKLYESFFDNPEVGDYVIIRPRMSYSNDFNNFIKNNVGQIEKITSWYHVEFDDLSVDWGHNFNRNEIDVYSKDKEELESILMAKKYNL